MMSSTGSALGAAVAAAVDKDGHRLALSAVIGHEEVVGFAQLIECKGSEGNHDERQTRQTATGWCEGYDRGGGARRDRTLLPPVEGAHVVDERLARPRGLAREHIVACEECREDFDLTRPEGSRRQVLQGLERDAAERSAACFRAEEGLACVSASGARGAGWASWMIHMEPWRAPRSASAVVSGPAPAASALMPARPAQAGASGPPESIARAERSVRGSSGVESGAAGKFAQTRRAGARWGARAARRAGRSTFAHVRPGSFARN
jgi:hypothetical protein